MPYDTSRAPGSGSPILVVGAGPVGLTAAAELLRYGLPVRLIDKSPRPTQTSKALVVWSRTLEQMERMGCAGDFVAAGLHAKGATMRHGAAVLGHTGFADIPSRYNYACMVPQSDTERLLGEHLGRLGGAVERQVELLDFSQGSSVVSCRLKHPDGHIDDVETPWLVGCDGAHSTVRHGLGLAFDGYLMDEQWILADVRLEGGGAPPADEIAVFFHRDGPFVVFPMPGGRSRVIATVGRADAAAPEPEPTLAEVQSLIDARTGGDVRATDPFWLSGFRINERKVHRYWQDRVLLAGDAAHVHSPAGGQGMNTGMQDATNLAWKLALVVRGDAAPTLLDSYSVERSAIGDQVLRNAARLTDMATLAHPAAQALRNTAVHVMLGFDAVKHRMAAAMSEMDIAYPKSPLSVGPQAGSRLDPERYGGPAPGAGSDPHFVLYAEDDAAARGFLARYPRLLEQAPRAPLDGIPMAIARPDGYLGFTARRADWDAAAAYLDALMPVAA